MDQGQTNRLLQNDGHIQNFTQKIWLPIFHVFFLPTNELLRVGFHMDSLNLCLEHNATAKSVGVNSFVGRPCVRSETPQLQTGRGSSRRTPPSPPPSSRVALCVFGRPAAKDFADSHITLCPTRFVAPSTPYELVEDLGRSNQGHSDADSPRRQITTQ